MALELKVHPSFFREFATKTWISTYDILRELIENAFDEDATKVIVTILSNGNVVIEDDAGMNFDSINKFLVLGSPHKSNENLSPKFKRIRTGRYGTGRLSFLTSFDSMKIKTKLDEFNKTLVINGNSLENLASGKAQLQELQEPPLKRNGTEILLKGSKIHLDVIKLSKELKKLSILKYPLFDVYIKNSEHFREWDIEGSQIVKSPDVQGYKIVVNIVEPYIMGEIIIAKRPLGIDEKGIAIMVGNHMVLRSTFGFENKLNRVTGYVKCDQLTSRFADKSALIENDIYFKFNQSMKDFIVNEVLPSLTEYEDVLITREESKIYKEIDKVMGQAVLETLQIDEEVDGFESVEVSGIHTEFKGSTYADLTIQSSQSTSILQNRHIRENNSTKEKDESNFTESISENHYTNGHMETVDTADVSLKLDSGNSGKAICENENSYNDFEKKVFDLPSLNNSGYLTNSKGENTYEKNDSELSHNNINNRYDSVSKDVDNNTLNYSNLPENPIFQTSVFPSRLISQEQTRSHTESGNNINSQLNYWNMQQQQHYTNLSNDNNLIKKTVRKPILKKTFTLKKIGYKVIPYEDENDSRYCFTNENIVFVNKAHSTYKVESERGDEFLFRHITNIVAEVVVGSRYPEARDILEIQNKLISEAIKLHDYSLLKK
ncbi:MAG: ATP-binding protein [Candidatus Nitrosocosmicus sp.]